MWFSGVELNCPHCRGDLEDDGIRDRVLRCTACSRAYPVILGIPDLRVFSDPYIDMESDRAKARRIAERYPDTDFEGLVRFYYSITPAVPPADAERYTRGLLTAVPRARASLATWGFEPDGQEARRFLDLGCGTAPLLVAASYAHQQLCGVDIAFRWLTVARKRLDELDVHAPLVCACAEALPFPDRHFDRVGAESVIETVRNQEQAAAEVLRVLGAGGAFGISTPNRFSLGPDPHIGLWATGFLPGSLIDWYARRSGAVPPVRRLLSVRMLRTLLVDAGFRKPQLMLPRIPEEQKAAAPALQATLIGLYSLLQGTPLAHNVLFLLGPLFHAVARRTEDSGSVPPATSGARA